MSEQNLKARAELARATRNSPEARRWRAAHTCIATRCSKNKSNKKVLGQRKCESCTFIRSREAI